MADSKFLLPTIRNSSWVYNQTIDLSITIILHWTCLQQFTIINWVQISSGRNVTHKCNNELYKIIVTCIECKRAW